MAIDLTYSELAAKLPANAIFDDPVKGICINVSLVTGDTIDDITDEGVAECFYKLLKAANAAQIAKNTNLAIGSQLNAFDSPSLSSPVINADGSYYTVARASVNARIAFGDTLVTGDMQ